MIHDTQNAQTLPKQDGRNIYVIMKTMCPPGYLHNGLLGTHTLEHMMYGYTFLVPMNQKFSTRWFLGQDELVFFLFLSTKTHATFCFFIIAVSPNITLKKKCLG